jgi:hypothetical protein
VLVCTVSTDGLTWPGAAASADDLDCPGPVREQPGLRRPVQVDDLDGARLDPAVADSAMQQSGHLRPGQPDQRRAQRRLVGLDGENR